MISSTMYCPKCGNRNAGHLLYLGRFHSYHPDTIQRTCSICGYEEYLPPEDRIVDPERFEE